MNRETKIDTSMSMNSNTDLRSSLNTAINFHNTTKIKLKIWLNIQIQIHMSTQTDGTTQMTNHKLEGAHEMC